MKRYLIIICLLFSGVAFAYYGGIFQSPFTQALLISFAGVIGMIWVLGLITLGPPVFLWQLVLVLKNAKKDSVWARRAGMGGVLGAEMIGGLFVGVLAWLDMLTLPVMMDGYPLEPTMFPVWLFALLFGWLSGFFLGCAYHDKTLSIESEKTGTA